MSLSIVTATPHPARRFSAEETIDHMCMVMKASPEIHILRIGLVEAPTYEEIKRFSEIACRHRLRCWVAGTDWVVEKPTAPSSLRIENRS